VRRRIPAAAFLREQEALDMPNDAKLGLVVGVGLVVTIAMVFFRKEPVPAGPPEKPSTTSVHSPSPPPPVGRESARPVKAKPAVRSGEKLTGQRLHTVKEGETLFSLAQHYYKDGNKFVHIYQANQEALQTPDPLTPGSVLVIPELPAQAVVREETPPDTDE
jgi:nucleoid-associated protein YgaU